MTTQRPQREQRFERKMSDAEALMWNVEKDPWLNPSGGTLIMLDRPVDFVHFRRQIAAAVAEVPRLRERVTSGLGRMSPPVWRPDPEFDLDYHIRHVALPAPADERTLLDYVTAVYQDPYDRTRPLWMFYVIDGLAGGRGALVWKIHHTVADGTGAGRLAEAYLQPSRAKPRALDVDLDELVAESVRADVEEHGNGPAVVLGPAIETLTHTARRQAGIARRLLGEVGSWSADPRRFGDAVAGMLRTVGQVRSEVVGDGGEGGSPLWRERSRHRHLELLSFRMSGVTAAAKALGGSLNDLFVTGAVDGVVGYHAARGVELTTLRTSFVVSTRNDTAIGGNSFTPVRISVPAGPMAPDRRFHEIGARMREKREGVSGQGMLSGLAGVANLLPTSLVTRVARSQAARMDFATSNMRGAKSRLYISGARIDGNYPFGPLAGTAFNLTTMSYAGRLDMSLHVDPVAVADPGDLRDHLQTAYEELIAFGS
jgi:WS/DGAT/MGAT family acyltransferase